MVYHQEQCSVHVSFLLDYLLWGGQSSCCEDAQTALWRSPSGKELRPPAISHVNEPLLEADLVTLVKPSDDCHPG